MKRLFIGFIVLGLGLSLAVGAFAAKGTVPKQLCLVFSGGSLTYFPTSSNSNNLSLAPKMSGTITMSGQPVKFYNITGSITGGDYSFPVVGSGYVLNNNFHFTIAGFGYIASQDQAFTYDAEGIYTLGANNAIVTFHWMECEFANKIDFTKVDCKNEVPH
jgi:hypothetical protein